MKIIEMSQDKASLEAEKFIEKLNLKFQRQLSETYESINQFWYKNSDESGNPTLGRVDGGTNEPTGLEMLVAMGTSAQTFMLAAYRRVEMILAIAQDVGKLDEIDMSKLQIPTVVYNEDGSVKEIKENE